MENALSPNVQTHQYVFFGAYELGMLVKTGPKTDRIIFFIEMKLEDSVLEAAILQAALHAYKYCTVERKPSLEIILVAVSLPNFYARIGVLRVELDKKTFHLKNSSFEVGDSFCWEKEEDALKLAAYLLSNPHNMTNDPLTDNAEVPTNTAEIGIQPKPTKRKRKKE
ncbi:MAG: uncharacterized protein A8A55_1468 [Amphiamblys sp. WSBS2006]|nr:MAG: uncharacterized protein A8A55_1468 [Amphiamblys sp. WSBS2006]